LGIGYRLGSRYQAEISLILIASLWVFGNRRLVPAWFLYDVTDLKSSLKSKTALYFQWLNGNETTIRH
jgi:hypothetical protein